jgi:MFS family permease
MYTLPVVAVFLFTGVFADRFDKQKVIFYSDLICFFISLFLCIAVYFKLIVLVYILLFLRTGVSKFSPPSRISLIRSILSDDEFSIAIGYQQMLLGVLVLFGGGVGIVSYWTVGVNGAILLDSISFLLSAILISRCEIDKCLRISKSQMVNERISISSLWYDFVEGIQYILSHPVLKALLSGMFFIGIINGGASVMSIFMMKYKLAPTMYEQMQLWISVVTAVGIVMGCLLAPILLRYTSNSRLFRLSFFIMGVVCVILITAI